MSQTDAPPAPHIVPRAAHNISREDISDQALKVLYRLHKAGYAAYLVGGGVRDLLLGFKPKDFDVATDALPEEVKELFRNCRLIGRRFRLAHIHFGREIVEVATFRGQHGDGDEDEALVRDGMIVRDNVYGTLEEDAWRRDFTVNALYYNIADFSLVDYTGGLEDLNHRRLRLIGDPAIRLQEDPVRILRAIRFAAKLDFAIDADLQAHIEQHKQRLEAVAPARLFDEVLKLFLAGHAEKTFEQLRRFEVLETLFAPSARLLAREDAYLERFTHHALRNTDTRIAQGKPVTPAFLFAALLWGPVRERARELEEQGMSQVQAMQEAGHAVIGEQIQQVSIPKRFRLPIREIWSTQVRLAQRRGRKPLWLLSHPRFRAAYDFLLLRREAGELELEDLCQWWTEFQEADEEGRSQMLQKLQGSRKPRRRRRKS